MRRVTLYIHDTKAPFGEPPRAAGVFELDRFGHVQLHVLDERYRDHLERKLRNTGSRHLLRRVDPTEGELFLQCLYADFAQSTYVGAIADD